MVKLPWRSRGRAGLFFALVAGLFPAAAPGQVEFGDPWPPVLKRSAEGGAFPSGGEAEVSFRLEAEIGRAHV